MWVHPYFSGAPGGSEMKYILKIFALYIFFLTVIVASGNNLTLASGIKQNNLNIEKRGLPKVLKIEKLNLNAFVESVGINEDGEMATPGAEANAVWWNKGAGMGETGSAVIAGHLDKSTGGPGIFYKLSSLSKGDLIEVEDIYGNKYEYKVTEIKAYENNEIPYDLVFSRNDKKYLNLITCYGDFDREAGNYKKRLVVFSEL